MSTYNISQPIRVGRLSADPSNPQNGTLYYNTTSGLFRQYQGGSWVDGTSAQTLAATTGASLIGYNNSHSGFSATNVQQALDDLYDSISSGHFSDSTFDIFNNADHTKILVFDASSIPTGTTVTLTAPSSNTNLGKVNTAIQKDGSVTYTANQPMGSNKLTGLSAGTTAGDSVRYEQAILTSGANAFAASQSMGGNNLTNLADPVNPQDAATKNYTDNLAQGLAWKQTARSATTGALPAYTYNNGASGVGATITATSNAALPAQDGVTLVVNDRLLVKNETGGNQPYNGIYVVTQVGSGSLPFILTRSTDANTAAKLQWATIRISPDASTQAGYGFRESDDITTIGTDNVAFTDIDQGVSYVFTSGVQLIGNTVSANVDNSTIDVNGSQQLEVKAGGITNTQVSSSAAIAYSKLNLTGDIVNSDISSSAAIAYSKLNLAASIVNSDIAAGAAIAYSKLNLAGSIVNSDIATGAAIARSKLASGTAYAWVTNNTSGVMQDTSVSANSAVATDSNGLPVASSTTATELGYVHGVTSSIQTQINGKLSSVSQDTAPSLGGNLNLNGQVVYNKFDLGTSSSATNFSELEYVDVLTLTGSTTADIGSPVDFNRTVWKRVILYYEMTEATTGNVRAGELKIVAPAAQNPDVTDLYEEANNNDLGVTWSVGLSSNTVQVSYTTANANNITMRCDIKRFRA